MRLLGVGHVSLDHVFQVQAIPTQAVKTPASHYACGVGGMTANAAVAASRLGGVVRFAGPVGDDDAAMRFVQHLAGEGIDTLGLTRIRGAGSSVSTVIVDAQGERLIVNHRGSALSEAPAFDATWLDGIDALMTDPRCPDWAAAALQAARRRGLPAVLDADTSPRRDLQRLVALAGWAVFSEPGLAVFAPGPPQQGLATALACGAAVAVVTLGAQGAMWQRPGAAPQQLPAFVVAPVQDTTAAGDVFHGALALALAEGQADAQALRFASAAAALKCLRRGAVLGAPLRSEVEELLLVQPR